MRATEDYVVDIRHVFKHARSRVFAAFASSGAMQSWFSPSAAVGMDVPLYDFTVGGRYQIDYRMPKGQRSILAGEFLSIHAPEALAFTFEWQPPDPHAGIPTRVSIELSTGPGITEMWIRHEKIASAAMRDRHDQGWQGTLSRLSEYLEDAGKSRKTPENTKNGRGPPPEGENL